ncbi:MAG: 50S ribosomal protein L22 [Patescibacteria group bacterium]
MKQSTATLKYLKITPRKARLIAGVIRGLPVKEAEAQLLKKTQRSAPAILKLLRSAMANAKNREINTDKLYVASIKVDQGPMLKRMLPRARGRATAIQKKMSHITLILEEKEGIVQPQFNVIVPKKDKKQKKEKKTVTKKKIVEEKKAEEKTREARTDEKLSREKRGGFLKKLFRRKNV